MNEDDITAEQDMNTFKTPPLQLHEGVWGLTEEEEKTLRILMQIAVRYIIKD